MATTPVHTLCLALSHDIFYLLGVGGDNYGECSAFVPDYPATSPYVTAVGGTALPLVYGDEYANGLRYSPFLEFLFFIYFLLREFKNSLTPFIYLFKVVEAFRMSILGQDISRTRLITT